MCRSNRNSTAAIVNFRHQNSHSDTLEATIRLSFLNGWSFYQNESLISAAQLFSLSLVKVKVSLFSCNLLYGCCDAFDIIAIYRNIV